MFNISKNLAQADRRSWMTTGTTDTSAPGSFHSPRHAGGCAVRPGGHVGRLPAVRVWRSARARGYGGSPGWRRSRWGPTRDRACRRSWGSPAVWSGAGGWRSGGGENIFSYVHVSKITSHSFLEIYSCLVLSIFGLMYFIFAFHIQNKLDEFIFLTTQRLSLDSFLSQPL